MGLYIEKVKLKAPPAYIYENLKTSPYSFFLDSALPSEKLSGFSFMGAEPFLIFQSKKNRITLDRITSRETLKGNPFLVLKDLFKTFKRDPGESPFPFNGGGVGYFSYDLKDFNEHLPDRATDDVNIPDCMVAFYDTILAFDHLRREYSIISSGERRGYENLKNKVMVAKRHRKIGTEPYFYGDNKRKIGLCPYFPPSRLESNFTKAEYIKTVKKAKEYIKAGDIYQVNLSQRFKTTLDTEPFWLYEILRTINPAPFASFLDFGDVKILSSSPERFLKKSGRFIETCPIKGTRPRGKSPTDDTRLKNELLRSAKDRAENLMIIDLERNDLGRISEYGSVRVAEFMACEKYASVFHLVSTVQGKLRKNIDAIDCMTNCFPGGSITGAPKIRSMEIIEELEPVKRSVYTGAIGYIGFDGNMDTSIAIRTLLAKDGVVYFHAGGGIVYDSDPEQEYQETLDKAKALIEAISYEDSVSREKICSA